MFTLRCTKRLLERMRVEAASDASSASTVLGNWYANLLYVAGSQIILAVSERTLLPVLLPAAGAKKLPKRLPAAVGDVLAAVGIPAGAIERELVEMRAVAVATTANRHVLGSMNDFRVMLEFPQERGETLLATALFLAETPCGPIRMESPRRATVAAFVESIH